MAMTRLVKRPEYIASSYVYEKKFVVKQTKKKKKKR